VARLLPRRRPARRCARRVLARRRPDEVAERIVAFVDGVGFETALGYRWTSPERMHERIVAFAAEQLGISPARLTDPGDRT